MLARPFVAPFRLARQKPGHRSAGFVRRLSATAHGGTPLRTPLAECQEAPDHTSAPGSRGRGIVDGVELTEDAGEILHITASPFRYGLYSSTSRSLPASRTSFVLVGFLFAHPRSLARLIGSLTCDSHVPAGHIYGTLRITR